MEFDTLLHLMVKKRAADLFITAGIPPTIKVGLKTIAVTCEIYSPQKSREVVLSVMNEDQRAAFGREKEANFAIAAKGLGRFRVSAFQQRNMVGMVIRRIESYIPTLEELGMPQIVKTLSMTKRGLIFFVGATGSGKSNSMASLIGFRNNHSTGHIISIEDPIEFIHPHDGCIITQREVGIDTDTFEIALQNTLRQSPDVILIGEIRTQQTMEYALEFAETGHLCIATLHANNADQALERIMNFFPEERHQQIWMMLSLNVKAIVAQQLVPKKDGTGRICAVEVMLNSPVIAELVRKGEVSSIKEFMKKSTELGMQTFDQDLFRLFQLDMITEEQALAHADSANDLRLMIKLHKEEKGIEADKGEHLSLKKEEQRWDE